MLVPHIIPLLTLMKVCMWYEESAPGLMRDGAPSLKITRGEICKGGRDFFGHPISPPYCSTNLPRLWCIIVNSMWPTYVGSQPSNESWWQLRWPYQVEFEDSEYSLSPFCRPHQVDKYLALGSREIDMVFWSSQTEAYFPIDTMGSCRSSLNFQRILFVLKEKV